MKYNNESNRAKKVFHRVTTSDKMFGRKLFNDNLRFPVKVFPVHLKFMILKDFNLLVMV